jgi:ABC-2 type transport system permease protein
MWSYRLSFFSDWLGIALQVLVFYFVGRLVDPSKLPSFGAGRTSYIEFVAIGLVFTSFLQIGLARIVSATRQEQLMGTLESLLVTPTAPPTLQLGLVSYDLAYAPIRTAVFLAALAALFGIRLSVGGLLPSLLVLLSFLPFVWGIGLIGAAGVLRFRRSTAIAFGTNILTGASSTYFPLSVMPGWLRAVAEVNPITVALQGVRAALLGSPGTADIAGTIGQLLPVGIASLVVGLGLFQLALRWERRRGTLGLY